MQFLRGSNEVQTPLGIGYIISRENLAGEVLVKLCKRDNAEWQHSGSYIFRMVSVSEVEAIMSDKEKRALAVKAIRQYAQMQFGWGAKYHPEQLEKYNALMEQADKLEKEGKK